MREFNTTDLEKVAVSEFLQRIELRLPQTIINQTLDTVNQLESGQGIESELLKMVTSFRARYNVTEVPLWMKKMDDHSIAKLSSMLVQITAVS